MVLSKRERVIRTLELEEPDIIPIFTLGFEFSGTAYQSFKKSEEYKECKTYIKNNFSRRRYKWAGSITQLRFFNVDCFLMDPFKKLKSLLPFAAGPPEYPNYIINVFNGSLFKLTTIEETGLPYPWYIDGYFKTPEILHEYWEKYGKPSEWINNKTNYSPQIWDEYVKSLEPYLYPMASLPIAMHESLIEGMTMGRVAYFMRKNPQFIHQVMSEYTKTNIEIVKRLAEAGVDIVFYLDDLGQKERSILSLKSFREFILPYYKQIYQACKKRGMFVAQHSCGYVDEFLPYMVDAGLNGIQALEPAAGVDLAHLKETLGDRLCFMGGMDSTRVLNFGTEKDIEEDVKKCIKAAASGGGYFAGPSHNILNVPWENLLIFRAAIEKYRKYPLKIGL